MNKKIAQNLFKVFFGALLIISLILRPIMVTILSLMLILGIFTFYLIVAFQWAFENSNSSFIEYTKKYPDTDDQCTL